MSPLATSAAGLRRSRLSVAVVVVFLCRMMVVDASSGGTVTTTTTTTTESYGRRLPAPEPRCPPGCTCVGSVERAVAELACTAGGLHAVPGGDGGWLATVLEMVVTGSRLPTLGAHTFAAARDLETLVLADNGIERLEPAVFTHLTRLRQLDLSGNRLFRQDPTAPAELFATLVHLQRLNLSGNALESLTRDAFSPLVGLTTLDLSANALRHLPSNTFYGLEVLERLNLSANNISRIEAGAFAGLRSMDALSLGSNALASLEANVFYGAGRLRRLVLSDNLIAAISPRAFDGLDSLTQLLLSGNLLSRLPADFTRSVPMLQLLDLSANPFRLLNRTQLAPGTHLQEVDLSGMPRLVAVLPDAFSGLTNLRRLNLSSNPQLVLLSSDAFGGCESLHSLDLSGCQLATVHGGIFRGLPSLRHLRLAGNPWRCDCGLRWMPAAYHANSTVFADASAVSCASSSPSTSPGRRPYEASVFAERNCTGAAVEEHSANVSFRVGSSALLECQAGGNPAPSLTWLTPSSHVLHWYPDGPDVGVTAILRHEHSVYHDQTGAPVSSGRLHVLRNGNLFISSVDTTDAGTYVCSADNALGRRSATVAMTLDYDMLMRAKVVSILAGLALSVAFLLTMLVYQLGLAILNRWGWGCCCCCPGALPPKARHIRSMLESVEHYKSQQLDRLRDNYNQQVFKIKDNCTQQMEKLRDSYTGQTERIRDIRDYGTQQMDRMRDQYYEQVRKVRDYSTQQMSRVRENYVSQRNRIRKFSAHQLFRLRENYKMQQLHLNKILENINLESCRNVCTSADSAAFASDPGFGARPALPPVEDFDGNVILPLELDPFELPPLPVLPVHHPLYLPPSPDELGGGLDAVPPPYLSAVAYAGSTSSEESRAGGTVELAEVVTYIVNPSRSASGGSDGDVNSVINV